MNSLAIRKVVLICAKVIIDLSKYFFVLNIFFKRLDNKTLLDNFLIILYKLHYLKFLF